MWMGSVAVGLHSALAVSVVGKDDFRGAILGLVQGQVGQAQGLDAEGCCVCLGL